MEIILIITALIIALVSLFAGYLSQKIARNVKEKRRDLQESYTKKVIELLNNYYKEIEPDIKVEGKEEETYLTLKFLSNFEKSWGNLPVHFPGYLSKAEIDAEVNKKFEEIKKRVEGIEKRFPKETTLEKIASVNDAILATNLEALSESIKRIEDRMLTKWDVVKILFQILAALGVLTTLIFAALKYLTGI